MKIQEDKVLSFEKKNYKLNREILFKDNRYYVKLTSLLGLIPNKQLTKQNKERLLQALYRIYQNWKREITKINQEYYLAIWVFDESFIDSQVVMGIKEYVTSYQKEFLLRIPAKPFPYTFHPINSKIESYWVLDALEKNDIIHQKAFKRRLYKRELIKDKLWYLIKKDSVWVIKEK